MALTAILTLAASRELRGQRADTAATRQVAPGVSHTRSVHNAGPWIVNVVRVDLRRRDLSIRHRRANDSLASRELVSAMARRLTTDRESVLVAVNADFFDVRTGASENNVLIDGEWWKGVRLTESPFDTFDAIHAQFALDSLRRPRLDRFAFDGWARSGTTVLPIIALNANPSGAPEGTALFTRRFGATAPRDPARTTSEVTLIAAGRLGDTLVYIRRGSAATTAGSAIPVDGAILAGYGARAREVAALAEGDTVRVWLGVSPRAPGRAAATPLALIIGGWPRIVRDGANIAGQAASEEGTISRNAEARHPRTAVGFSRDSSTLFLVTVDGRSTKSVGVTTSELANLMRVLGVWQGLNFDGGGSTTMVVEGRIVNTPADPSGERPVGNALLVLRARRP
jgi:hypothetical protein